MPNTKPFRIGIIGGMGPKTDVLLQQFIIEATPAQKDQDHFQLVCFSNPKIPDRTYSLENDDGREYVRAIRKTARALIDTGVDLLAIPCNTAHARLAKIQRGLPVPIVNMVTATAQGIKNKYPSITRAGVLATDGTLRTQLYEHALIEQGITQVRPRIEDQKAIMGLIYRIKSGEKPTIELILPIINRFIENGVECVITGCTELSLLHQQLSGCYYSTPIIDPLRTVAEHIVSIGLKHQETAPR